MLKARLTMPKKKGLIAGHTVVLKYRAREKAGGISILDFIS
jgi:hypothetical protein